MIQILSSTSDYTKRLRQHTFFHSRYVLVYSSTFSLYFTAQYAAVASAVGRVRNSQVRDPSKERSESSYPPLETRKEHREEKMQKKIIDSSSSPQSQGRTRFSLHSTPVDILFYFNDESSSISISYLISHSASEGKTRTTTKNDISRALGVLCEFKSAGRA